MNIERLTKGLVKSSFIEDNRSLNKNQKNLYKFVIDNCFIVYKLVSIIAILFTVI